MWNLTGKVALVTGATGGIGSAICRALKSSGALVAAADINPHGCNADATFPGDLSDRVYASSLPQATVDQLGKLDILINNAGIIRRGDITQSSDKDMDDSIAINIDAPFQTCRAAIPLMAAAGGGSIINTASCWGLNPGPNHALYCMTKAAVASLTQCMGRDHAHQGIRINAVCPNEVDTPMLRSGFEARGLEASAAIEALNATVPLGRIAQPDDIADVVLFLASDQSRYICGELIQVNGGKPVA